MTRNKDTESHRRMAAEQELKVAENAGEHQVKIGTRIEVEKQKSSRVEKTRCRLSRNRLTSSNTKRTMYGRAQHRNKRRGSKQPQIAEEATSIAAKEAEERKT